VVRAIVEVVRAGGWGAGEAAWVTWVPSRAHDEPLRDLVARMAGALGVEAFAAVGRVAADAPPQREMANAAQQVANVRGAFRVAAEVPAGPCLLVDDRRLSGWTLAMVGGQLRARGVPAVWPLALATAL
jgi:ATP-dependent DNA helicase RecQ